MDAIATVRAFNRTVTQRIGALDDAYLQRGRPLGASRVLWELGNDGADLRELRDRLGLDSGYLSRLLRTLEAEGLVTVEADPGDGRVRIARPTAAGRAELGELNRLSDDQARNLLDPLSARQRDALVAAMDTVRRLLLAGQIELALEAPDSPDTRAAFAQYYAELDTRFVGGFQYALAIAVGDDELRPPRGAVLLARLGDRVIGCGAIRLTAPDTAHLKRMWVHPDARGLGLGRRLLAALEAQAATLGATRVQLETNRTLPEAIEMYRSGGYREVEPFNDERYGDLWFEKTVRSTPLSGG